MDEGGFMVRLRGLPWSATAGEVTQFLDECEIVGGEKGVHFMLAPGGRASGEAFVELASDEDVQRALLKNKCHMGRRYIDVMKAKRKDMELAMMHSQSQGDGLHPEAVVRLRGLPFGCSKEEIAHFFAGLPIAPNGITILTDHLGRTNGLAFVQFLLHDDVGKALQKHKGMIGRRYIEVFQSSVEEIMATVAKSARMHAGIGNYSQMRPYSQDDCFRMPMGMRGRLGFNRSQRGRGYFDDGFIGYGSGQGDTDCSGYAGFNGLGFGRGSVNIGNIGLRGGPHSASMRPGQRGGRGGGVRPFVGGFIDRGTTHESQTGHTVHMRGLPYSASERDIAQFFYPLNIVNITIHYNKDGRPSGAADVDFATHDDATVAMQRNRALMQKRYIELFLNSTASEWTPHIPAQASDWSHHGQSAASNWSHRGQTSSTDWPHRGQVSSVWPQRGRAEPSNWSHRGQAVGTDWSHRGKVVTPQWQQHRGQTSSTDWSYRGSEFPGAVGHYGRGNEYFESSSWQ